MVRGNAKMKKKASALQQIYVPKCCQQPRSSAPKPRTDFSLFFSSSSSSPPSTPSSSLSSASGSALDLRPGSGTELWEHKDSPASFSAARVDKGRQSFISLIKDIHEFPLVQCSMSQNGGKEAAFTNSTAIPFAEFEFSRTTILNNYDNRNNEECKTGEAADEFCTPNKSALQLTEYNDLWIAPGSTVWAKNASQIWWPAKIMGEQSTTVSEEDNCVTGRILVQYYGNHECVWLDPAGDVSQFDECFEERSCNPMEAFQDALRQALNTKEQPTFCKQLDTDLDRVMTMGQHEQSSDAQSDKCIESSSSKTKEKFVESGRGKRTRKPKVHFDEVNFSANKSARKMRRFRIMRHLGLAAPIGSPFSLTSRIATANKSSSLLDI